MKKNTLSFLLLFLAQWLFSQQITTDFGKNRVQFNKDFKEWLQYESPNFVAYWYGPARNVGQAAVQFAEYDQLEIQNILEHRINDKIQIIVYTDLSDVKQSNIGESDVFSISGSENQLSALDFSTGHRMQDVESSPSDKVIGNKIFVYFDGNHQHLRRQIREGIASVYLTSMLYGSNIQEVVQNAIAYSLPEWYREGIVAYTAEEWSVENDNLLKDVIFSPQFVNFKKFSKKNPRLAGHAFWYFVSQTYGKQTLSNLLYLTRINRNVESGFQYILGGNTNKIYESWLTFFEDRYTTDLKGKEAFTSPIALKYKGKIPVQSAKLSPDGKQIAYVTNEVGKAKVFLQDIATGKRKLLLKTGFYNNSQTTDYDFPIVAWKPNGYEVSIIYEKNDIIKLYTYDLMLKKSQTEPLSTEFQRVYSADYVSNSELALSATTNGFSDIFIYRIIGRNFERITNDFYDDLDVAVTKINKRKGLLWSSNRPDSLLAAAKMDSILPIQSYDIFYFDLEKRTKNPIQLTATPDFDEKQPIGIDSTFFAYLTTSSGIINRDIAYLDTVFDHYRTTILNKEGARQVIEKDFSPSDEAKKMIDSLWKTPIYRTVAVSHHHSNFGKNIIAQHISTKKNTLADLTFEDRRFKLYVNPLDVKTTVTPLNTIFRQIQIIKKGKKQANYGNSIEKNRRDSIIVMAKVDTVKLADTRYEDYFQSPFPNSLKKEKPIPDVVNIPTPPIVKNKTTAVATKEVLHEIHLFKGARVIPYRLKFRTDDVNLLKFDNRPLVNSSEIFTGGFSTQPLGMLSNMVFKDLLEDHRLEIGARFSLFGSGKYNTFNNSNGSVVNAPSAALNNLNTTFNSNEFYVTYFDKKNRFDKKYTFYRRTNNYTETDFSDSFKSQLTSDVAEFQLTYPLSIYAGLRLTSSLRLDKLTYQATDSTTLDAPARSEQRVGINAEYIYDNALQIGTNLWSGTRFKVYSQMIKGLQVQVLDDAKFDLKNGFLGVFGFDARHYQRIERKTIVALRMSGATSFGREKMLYVLGGMEGMLRAPIANNLSLPQGDFAYVMPANQMRGFSQNIRNGNSVLLFNAELRVPVTQYVFKNARSSWLKNLQMIGFFDAGTAWHGASLFKQDNPLNTIFLPDNPNSPIKLKVNYFRDPIVAGYGAGVRTTLAGYYIKFDYAWGIETRIIQTPIKYLSLGTDF